MGVDLVQSEMELKEKLEEIGIRNLSMKGLEILEEKTLAPLQKPNGTIILKRKIFYQQMLRLFRLQPTKQNLV
jgi:hypothetical protein